MIYTCALCGYSGETKSSQRKYCHKCSPIAKREYKKQYYIENKERIKKHRHTYYIENHERLLKEKKTPKNLAASRAWKKAHPEQVREYMHKWSKANQEKRRIYEHNRRASMTGNGGKLPPNIEAILFDEQEGFCYLCGELLYGRFDDPPSIEHKIPSVRGGSNEISNIGLAHISCNCKKHTKTPEEFMGIKE